MDTIHNLSSSASSWVQGTLAEAPKLSLSALSKIFCLLRESSELEYRFQDAVAHLGSWLGDQLADSGGTWVGLGHTLPPRIQLGDRCYSPFDEVARRLHPSLLNRNSGIADCVDIEELTTSALTDFASWQEATTAALEANKIAWEELSTSPRFSFRPDAPATFDQATASLDPWLVEEGIHGKSVLCLAAGGGTHAPLLSSAGAIVTVVDQSQGLLEIDQAFSQQNGLSIRCIQSDMHDLRALANAEFDVVLQPVATSYSNDLRRLFLEVTRVLSPGGLYVSQHKSPIALQSSRSSEGYAIVSRQGLVRIDSRDGIQTIHEAGCRETSHSLSEIIGGVCAADMFIEDFQEPCHADAWAENGSLEHFAQYCPPYVKLKARKR